MSRMTMWAAILAVAVAMAAAFGAGDARAAFGVAPENFVTGSSSTQAGGHPDVTTTFETNEVQPGNPDAGPDETIRDLRLDLPPGLVANPTLAPVCTVNRVSFRNPRCPRTSAVGTVDFKLYDSTNPSIPLSYTTRLYRVNTIGDEAAAFAFNAIVFPVRISAFVGPETGYRVRTSIRNLNESMPLIRSTVTLWGQPSEHQGDGPRNDLGETFGGPLAGATRRGFVTAPSRCDGQPLETALSLASWQTGQLIAPVFSSVAPVTGCDQLRFTPSVAVRPQVSATSVPAGVEVELSVPQAEDGEALATPDLRTARVTLPAGFALSPAAGDGLEGCTDAQFAIGANAPDSCPKASKIGSTSVDTPLLEEPLSGAVYVGSQLSDDPQSGKMFRLFITARAPGAVVKLAGAVAVDPVTGQMTATFADNPEVPFNRMRITLDGGSRAALANPRSCGTYTSHAELTPWSSDIAAVSDSALAIDERCGDQRFAPTFTAGSVNPSAGASSPFSLVVARSDGEQELSSVDTTLPPGLLAKLAGVPQCPEAQAAKGTCDVASRIGAVQIAAGSGSAPLAVPQPGKAATAVYLAGPYKGAPFSLSIVVPAQAGPFDLGTVVVRAALFVDPVDAHVTVVSDPLPPVVSGVPVRLQRLAVLIDRPEFMLNPTSCAPKQIGGTLHSVAGATAPVAARFQAADCASLGYAPKLAMTMVGKGQTKDGAHPALAARLTPPAGDANSKKVTVTLPLALALDPGNANGLCEPADAAANKCPANTVVGSARAQSVLPDTLTGPVYFVRGERIDSKGKVRKTLPKLFIPLSANGVTVYIHASSDVEGDRLVTTFDNLPDAPFSSFDLNIDGGEHGILAVSNTNVCAATQVADAEFGGQNGKAYTSKVTMGTPCALGVVKSSHTATALKVTVGGLGAGKVSGSGNGVSKSSRKLSSATTATLALKLTKATRRALAQGRDVKVKVKVAFTAKGQKKAKTATKTVVLHGAKKR